MEKTCALANITENISLKKTQDYIPLADTA